jgi:hypothetical protein
MKLKKIFFAFAIMAIITSCQQPVGNTAHIKGLLTGASGLKLTLLEMDTREIHPVDSVIPDHNGQFSFSPVIKESGFWLLKAPSGKVLVLMLSPGNQVDLTGSAIDFPDQVIVKGPEEAVLLNNFYHHTRLNEKQVDSLDMIIADHQDSSDYYQLTQKLDTSFKQIWENQRNNEMAFINKNPGSIASLLVLNYAFGLSPVLSPEEDFGFYQKLDSTLSAKFPENKHVKFHHQRVLEIIRNTSAPSAPRQTQRK